MAIRSRADDGLTLQVVVYAGQDQTTGKERYLRETVRGTTPTKTRKTAEAIERRLRLQVDERSHVTTTATVSDLLDAWLDLVGPTLSPKTVSGYRSHIERHLRPQLGALELTKLTTRRLDRHYGALRDSGLAPMTVRHVHAILRRALSYAVRWSWIPINPAAVEGTAPKIRKRTITPPTVAVAHQLLAAALARKDIDFGIIVAVAFGTGARRGELVALRWPKIDLDTAVITIDESVVDVGHVLYTKGTKTDESRRVAIDPDTVTLLRAHHQACLERAMAAGVKLDPDAYVASRELDGTVALWPDSVSHRFRNLSIKLGARARFHDIRHFHATQLLDAGVPLPVVSERLGHASIATTAEIYGHAVPESDRRAADANYSVMRGQSTERIERQGR